MIPYLTRLFQHLQWADDRTLEALRAAGTPPSKALELHGHIVTVEHVWLCRLQGIPARHPIWPAYSVEQSAAVSAETNAAYATYLAGLDAAAIAREVSYVNSAGDRFSSSVEDILLHVALHGAYHRGQVAQLLRQSDAAPASTDYIAFTRGAPAATRQDRPR